MSSHPPLSHRAAGGLASLLAHLAAFAVVIAVSRPPVTTAPFQEKQEKEEEAHLVWLVDDPGAPGADDGAAATAADAGVVRPEPVAGHHPAPARRPRPRTTPGPRTLAAEAPAAELPPPSPPPESAPPAPTAVEPPPFVPEPGVVAPSAPALGDTIPRAPASRVLPANDARALRIYDSFPALASRFSTSRGVDVRVCVSAQGYVSDAVIGPGPAAPAAQTLRRAILNWRYRPLTVDGAPTAFCHLMRISYQAK